MVTVSGNGTYTTPIGYTLPSTGTVTGTYQWDASYSGDGNNSAVSDNNNTNEQVTVSTASPTLSTTPTPNTLALGVTLHDMANLAGGFNPTGTITFTLFFNGGSTPVDTETVTVSGNGSYTTPVGYTLPTTGTVTGTYQWDASYSGDTNNNAASDVNNPNEQVTVNAPSPAISTAPSPTSVTLGTNSVTLQDTADLTGGLNATGTITFTLFYNGGSSPVDTETVAVNGNGTYTTPTGYTLPSTGTVTGTYQWDATYSGDTNNNAASDVNNPNEQVTVSAASPRLTTTPTPATVALGANPVTLTDTATLAGGFNPTGTITFTLFLGSTLVDTETATVSGNGSYTTPTGYTLPSTGTVTGTYQWDATYSGDGNNNAASDNNAANEQVTVSAASPTLSTTPTPATVALGANPVTLTDAATLAGGFNPTGTITFTLFYNGGSTPVDTEMVTVSGNGTYTTPTGYRLPTTGTVTGTYQWDASYSGDTNNNAVSDNNAANEQVTVSPASPTIATTPSPTSVTLSSATPPLLTDSATLADGYHPTGTITFTLFLGSTLVDTETATVTGNGTYTTPTGYTLPTTGTVTGTYQWDASYSGDTNNNAVSDNNAANEQVTVNPASPTITTTPSPATITLSIATPPLLTDSATLAGGYHPSGTITFTLFLGGTLVDTEMVTVSGNGTYTTPIGYTLPTTGTVTGTYQWDASYSGDANNNAASDNSAANEQVTVSAASPAISTTPSPTTITLSSATPPVLTDAATLSGGYHPTGNITFSLFLGSTLLDTEMVPVTGNGTYTTPTGYTLPSTGTVTGTYQWDASYSGDSNNAAASDNNAATERVTVQAASPTLTTTPNPTTVTLAATTVTLTDTANLQGGYHPTGTLTFTLHHGSTVVDTETIAVAGNGTYTTPTGFTLPSSGTVTGAYQWDASYSGDANNLPVTHNRATTERVTVSPASPTLSTTPNPTAVTLGATAPPILTDSATLSGGYHPSGTLTFTLHRGSTVVHTETVSVTGNGTYTTPTGYTLPTTGTVSGAYQWDASYSGDSNNHTAKDYAASTEKVTVTRASPTLTTAPDPSTVTLATNPVTLTDAATLSGGYHPSGTITFTLHHGRTVVNTETVSVTGNGTYTTPTGYTLPTTGTVTGTYQWDAAYSGNANNNAVSDRNSSTEQVTITAASPTLTTTPDSATVTLGTTPVTLKDSADLEDGYHPTGTITFTLLQGGTLVHTETVSVNGNGTYTTPAGFTLPTAGTVTGAYQWDAAYSGNANNHAVSDNGSSTEQVSVGPASPTLTTTPNPTTVTLGTTPVTLTDTALLVDGYDPTGTITFTLLQGGIVVDTETVAVSGNGTYTTPTGFTLPTSGTVAGTYQWDATYSGDGNNNAVSDANAADEQVTVNAATPTITTTPNPTVAIEGTTLQDAADLAGGYGPTGSITFSLYAPGVDPRVGPAAYSETVAGVSGDGTYHTSTGFPSNAQGIWNWVATYNGDANNNAVSTGPFDEPVSVSEEADLALTKVVNASQVTYGTNVTFTLTVHNLGPNTATDVFVYDPLPAGLTFVSATPSQGTYAPQSGTWIIGTLPAGGVATLQLTARVAALKPIVNRAETGADQFDPDLSNNVGSATVTGDPPFVSKRSFLASTDPDPAPAPRPAQPLPALDTVLADILFVEDVYQYQLGQDPDTAELAQWMNFLLLGGSRSVVVNDV